MRLFILALLSFSVICPTFAETPTVTASPVIPAASVTPVSTQPVPSTAPTVAVAAPSAPPKWAQELIVAAEKLPVVGPWVAKALLWSGILAGILTTLVAAVLAIVQMLMGVANLSGLTTFGNWLTNFQNGQVMYWLKFFSLFNAKKPDDPATGPVVGV